MTQKPSNILLINNNRTKTIKHMKIYNINTRYLAEKIVQSNFNKTIFTILLHRLIFRVKITQVKIKDILNTKA